MKKVAVALSSGVDSLVSALLLLEQGYEVCGVHFLHCEKDKAQISMLKKLAKKLNITLQVFDLRAEFQATVEKYFIESIKNGLTPNPCIFCNKFFKFQIFMEQVFAKIDCDFLATGHFSRKIFNPKTQLYELHIPKDKAHDQTYFLYQLSQRQLAKIIFPLENMTKDEVRNFAKKNNYSSLHSKNSTDICFLQDTSISQYLSKYLLDNCGSIRDKNSREIVGSHSGLHNFTIGQRKNLGVGGVKNCPDAPWFVVEKNSRENELVVSQNKEDLLHNKFFAKNLCWISEVPQKQKFDCKCQIRFRGRLFDCQVEIEKNNVQIISKTPVVAPTYGQSVVFWDGEKCLGGAEIC